MNPRTQKWLVTALAGIIASVLSRPLSEWLLEEDAPPERRGITDDFKEAAFKAGVSLAATVIASVAVRQLIRSR
jgi:hypothetical protein